MFVYAKEFLLNVCSTECIYLRGKRIDFEYPKKIWCVEFKDREIASAVLQKITIAINLNKREVMTVDCERVMFSEKD